MSSGISINYSSSTDKDGRTNVRPAIAVAGASMYYSGPIFTAAKSDSGVWRKINPLPPFDYIDRNWVTVKTYDINGTEVFDEVSAVKTVVDITINKNIELTGGSFAIPNILPGAGEWSVWAYAAPDVPAGLGGAIPFAEDIVIDEFYEAEDIVIDGRVTKMLEYYDVSNMPSAQWAANINNAYTISISYDVDIGGGTMVPACAVATSLDQYLTLIGYNATQFTTGDIIVLMMGQTDPALDDLNLWHSYMYNGGTSQTSTDFTSTARDFGSGSINSATLNLDWIKNRIRFILSHPAGLNPSVNASDVAKFQIILDSYIKW